MILYETALWLEERQKLSAAIVAAHGDTAFLRKKRRHVDEEIAARIQSWLAPAALQSAEAGTVSTADMI